MDTPSKLPFAFFGTPELVVPILDELKKNGYLPKVIVTNPDRPVGRKAIITPPPAKVWAMENAIPFLQPEKLDADFLAELAKHTVELGVVVAYGKILPQVLIDTFPKGMVNVHYSLLPKYRGATPVESAVLSGDKATGVTIQQLVFKLDAGPILKTTETQIGEDETAPALRDRLNEMAKGMLVEVLQAIESGAATAAPQDATLATFCTKIEKENGLIDDTLSDEEKYRHYKAYFGWPGIYFMHPTAGRIKITDAEFRDGKFIIKKVTPEGKKETPYEAFLKN